MQWNRKIEVLTPLFNRGAYQDEPEIRVPSIRGMVRWWFRSLGGSADQEKEAFGGMAGMGQSLKTQVKASRLVFRVSNVKAGPTRQEFTLPHKSGGHAGPKAAFPPGATFELEVFTRFGHLQVELESKVKNTLEAWLLLGALGLRANRAGGSVWPGDASAPVTPQDLKTSLENIGCAWPVMLAGVEAGSSLDQLRAAATDTVEGMPHVFGKIKGGRVASKVKFKIVRLESRFRLLIFAPEQRVLDEAREALKGHKSKPDTWCSL